MTVAHSMQLIERYPSSTVWPAPRRPVFVAVRPGGLRLRRRLVRHHQQALREAVRRSRSRRRPAQGKARSAEVYFEPSLLPPMRSRRPRTPPWRRRWRNRESRANGAGSPASTHSVRALVGQVRGLRGGRGTEEESVAAIMGEEAPRPPEEDRLRPIRAPRASGERSRLDLSPEHALALLEKYPVLYREHGSRRRTGEPIRLRRF